MPDAPPTQLALDFSAAIVQNDTDPRTLLLSLFEPDAATALRFALRAIDLADLAIERARERHPDGRGFGRAFMALQPRPALFDGAGDHVLASHFDELLDRVAAGQDLERPTAAEACCALREVSLAAPLVPHFAAAYAVFFADAFGEEQAQRIMGEEMVRRALQDRDEHLVADAIGDINHQLRDVDRGKLWRARQRKGAAA